MKTEPQYISRAERCRAAWIKTGETLGLPADIVREVFLDCFFQFSDFHALVAKGKFTRDQIMGQRTVEEIAQRIADRKAARAARGEVPMTDLELDFCDRMNFHCKSVLEIGDELQAEETKTFLSGGEYLTKGKCYRITSFTDEGFGEFKIITTTNFLAPDDRHWTSSHAIKRLFRAGKLVWDWKAAYICVWNACYPDQPHPIDEEASALLAGLGWPVPTVLPTPV